nr:MAG TPA: hypothetical protein [Caudoviricetes sp.]
MFITCLFYYYTTKIRKCLVIQNILDEKVLYYQTFNL